MTRSIGPMWSLNPSSACGRMPPPVGRPRITLKGAVLDAAPFPSSAMSLGLGIPWQVALQQSLPPLPQPEPLCNDKESSVEQFSADGTCLTGPRVSKLPAVHPRYFGVFQHL